MSGPLDTAALDTLMTHKLEWTQGDKWYIDAGPYRICKRMTGEIARYGAYRMDGDRWIGLGTFNTVAAAKNYCLEDFNRE